MDVKSKFECKGVWQIPTSNQRLNGYLRFTDNNGFVLDLFDAFEEHYFMEVPPLEIIYGDTTLGGVTLIDCQFNGAHYSHGILMSSFYPKFIFKGIKLTNLAELQFRKVSFEAFNLFHWINISGKEYKKKSQSEYFLAYAKPENISFTLYDKCSGEISFSSPVQSGLTDKRIDIIEKAHITFEYNEETAIQKVLKDIRIFIGFLTFVTFEGSYPLNIELQGNEKNQWIELFQNHVASPIFKEKHMGEHLVSYERIQSIFPTVILNWYSYYKKLEPVFNLMIYSLREKKSFSVEKFMDMTRALETFHRRTQDNNRIPAAAYEELVKYIVGAVDLTEENREWLDGKFKYGNEPSLSKRITNLIRSFPNNYIQKHFPNRKLIDKFCRQVVDSRNYYTHYDKNLEDVALNVKELHGINKKLMGLLFSCIMSTVGIDEVHFEKDLDKLLGGKVFAN